MHPSPGGAGAHAGEKSARRQAAKLASGARGGFCLGEGVWCHRCKAKDSPDTFSECVQQKKTTHDAREDSRSSRKILLVCLVVRGRVDDQIGSVAWLHG